MEFQKTHDLAKIIMKYLRDDATRQEIDEIERWRDASYDNAATFENVTRPEFLAEEYKAHQGVDTASAYMEFGARCKKNRSRRRVRTLAYSAAACVAVLLSIYLFPDDSPDGADIEMSPHKLPTLSFDDGKEISLDNSEVLSSNGGIMVKNNDGTLQAVVSDSAYRADATAHITINVTKGYILDIILEDGTHVWLNSDSRMRYPVRFGNGDRRVELSGEAYFEVAKDAQRRFVVESRGQSLEVLGTEFNISAYADETEVVTSLISGSVRVTESASGSEVTLLPGQQSSLDLKTKAFAVNDVNTTSIMAWKDGLFVFDGEPLAQIMTKISRWYDVGVVFDNAAVGDIVFRGNLPRDVPLDVLLRMIERTSSVRFTMKGNTIYVKIQM